MAQDVIIDGQAPLPVIAQQIADYEAVNLKLDRSANNGCITAIVGILATVCLASLGPLAFGGLALTVGGTIWYYAKHSKKYTGPRFSALKEILRTLSKDMPLDKPVKIKADCRGATHSAKLKEKVGGGMFSGQATFLYEDPWLDIAGKTHDGTAVRLVLVETTKVKEKYKSKGRVKRRSASNHKARVRVVASAKSFTGIRKEIQTLKGKSIHGGLNIGNVNVKGRMIDVVASKRGDANEAIFALGVLSFVFSHLQPRMLPKVRKKVNKLRKPTAA